MKAIKTSVFIVMASLCLPAGALADGATSDICRDMATTIRAQKTPVPLWQWPGIETERIINTIDGKDDPAFKPVLQADKARLLQEAQANDLSRAYMWRILLASNRAELARAGDFQHLDVYELHSRHLGRLVYEIGGDLYCTNVSDYYTGSDGKVHIPVQAASTNQPDGFDVCEADGTDAYFLWHGQVMSIDYSVGDDTDLRFSVSRMTGENRWEHACQIEAIYPFVYRAKAFSPYETRTPAIVALDNPYNQFMAAQVDAWGHAYRPYYDKDDPANRAAIQQKVFEAYARTHGDVDLAVFKAAVARDGVYVTGDDMFFPVFFEGQTYLVTALQGWLRQEPQSNIEFEIYALKDGKAVLVGALDTERVAGNLEKLTIKPG